jgi:hypothetical protein
VEGSRVFASFDLVQAYWQYPLEARTQEVLSIQTFCGLSSPTRLLQGSTAAGNHLQAVTADEFSPLSVNLLQYKDSFLLQARSETALLLSFRTFIDICRRLAIRVSVKKPKLFLQ